MKEQMSDSLGVIMLVMLISEAIHLEDWLWKSWMVWLRQHRRWLNWWRTRRRSRRLMVNVLQSVAVSFKSVIPLNTNNIRCFLSLGFLKAASCYNCCSFFLIFNFSIFLGAFTHDLACATIIIVITAINNIIYLSFTYLLTLNVILTIWLIR